MDPTGPQPDQLTVLVVDDDDAVRDLVEMVLETAGYHVIATSGGSEALAALDDGQNEVSLVILDRNLEGMTGEATFAGIRARKPDVPVILVSGNLEGDALRDFPAPGPKLVFQQKPFSSSELQNRVLEVLALDRAD